MTEEASWHTSSEQVPLVKIKNYFYILEKSKHVYWGWYYKNGIITETTEDGIKNVFKITHTNDPNIKYNADDCYLNKDLFEKLSLMNTPPSEILKITETYSCSTTYDQPDRDVNVVTFKLL